jgi:cystathionine gamma-synthase/methionine-gamma-lyase
MEQKIHQGVNTICVHTGSTVDTESSPVTQPIIMSNSYTNPIGAGMDGRPYFGYVRDNHTNGHYLERQLAALEEGEDCLVVASGVAAINLSIVAMLKAGDHIVCSKPVYMSVYAFLKDQLSAKYGVELTFVDCTNLNAVKGAVRSNTKMIHIETPGNPITRIIDIAAISKIAKSIGAMLSVDSTWASPIHQKPLKLGADLVMHSLTKYINGHGDAGGGAVIGSTELITKIRIDGMVRMGAPISPFNAWLIMRGITTLPLRMQQHCITAMKVAEFLENHHMVEYVWYPGLPSHPQHETAKMQMHDGFSGMMSLRLKTDIEGHELFTRVLKVVTRAVSLGHPHSLVWPFAFYDTDLWYHVMKDVEGKEPTGFLRMSIGLESADDIINDLDQALHNIKHTGL